MNIRRTFTSVAIMVIAGIAGLYVGASLNAGTGWETASVFSMISGIACIIYTLDNRKQ